MLRWNIKIWWGDQAMVFGHGVHLCCSLVWESSGNWLVHEMFIDTSLVPTKWYPCLGIVARKMHCPSFPSQLGLPNLVSYLFIKIFLYYFPIFKKMGLFLMLLSFGAPLPVSLLLPGPNQTCQHPCGYHEDDDTILNIKNAPKAWFWLDLQHFCSPHLVPFQALETATRGKCAAA